MVFFERRIITSVKVCLGEHLIYYKEVAVLFERKRLEVEEFHSWWLKVIDIRNKPDKTEV